MIPVLVFALAACTNAYPALLQQKDGVTPVQKVIQLLQDMAAKGKAEKADEAVKFSAYKQFCDDTATSKQNAIKEANAMIETLQADIQKAESDAAVLTQQIAELDADIAAWNADKKAATEVRTSDKDDYRLTHKDYTESIDALGRAIIILKRQAHDREQDSALIQVTKMARVPETVKRTIASFLATDSEVVQDPMSVSAPQANAYEFQSGGVVEMLEQLEDKFKDERNTLEKEEMQAKHAFEMQIQDLVDQIEGATKTRGRHAVTKSQREQSAAEAKGDLADTTQSRDEDSEYLSSLVAQCGQKSQDFESRQQLRAEELEAIQKAIEIISSPDVAGASGKHLALVQKSFALRASGTARVPAHKVAAYLQTQADKLQSKQLALLAAEVAADPFAKVKKMIDAMITKLLEEANEEADHKGWCDTEMATNKQTREDKTEEVNALTAESDKLKADIMKLSQQIVDLTDAIAEIDASVAKATEVREAEKAKNKATIEDAQGAQTAVEQALAVLKDFYAKAAKGAENLTIGYDGRTRALLQAKGPEDDAPETFDEPYTGMGGASGGVMGLLEVIQSDFSRLEAETTAAEADAAKAFDRFMAESKKDKAVKTADMDHKKKSQTQKESDLQDTTTDLKGTQKELDAALFYYEKLKPSCVATVEPYEERVAKREAEIESLRMALRILSGDDIA